MLRSYPFYYDPSDAVEIMDGLDGWLVAGTPRLLPLHTNHPPPPPKEATFGWVTVNYLRGSVLSPAEQTACILDLGGGSTQIALAVAGQGLHNELSPTDVCPLPRPNCRSSCVASLPLNPPNQTSSRSWACRDACSCTHTLALGSWLVAVPFSAWTSTRFAAAPASPRSSSAPAHALSNFKCISGRRALDRSQGDHHKLCIPRGQGGVCLRHQRLCCPRRPGQSS